MNPEPLTNSRPVRFGESFELDLKGKQLRRYGQPVRLERIPLEILILLIIRKGEIVSREEIIAGVWGEGAFLDTDNAINGSVRKIRQVLKDNPEQPKYIQTVTSKGYIFIAEVRPKTEAPAAESVSEPSKPEVVRRQLTVRALVLLTAVLSVLATTSMFILNSRKANLAQVPTNGKYMLAVLPLENLTGDPGQDYFSDGLTEEMITQLGNLDPEHLGIIARTSVMQYKNNKGGLSRIEKDLGIHYALEGSVRRESGKVRITVQLIQMKDKTHVWARQYDRELSSLLSLEDEIAREVAQEIKLTFAKGDATLKRPNLSSEQIAAYDSYLRGRYFWNKRTAEGFEQAIKYFNESVAKDPGYARAYVGLADTYALISGYDLAPKGETIPKAIAAANKALALDSGLAEAHASMALIAQNYQWDWKKAEFEYRKAIELDPNYATARHWYAEFLTIQGRFPEALEEIERARQLDPLSLIIAADRGAILYCARRYDEAIDQLKAVLEMEPNFPRAHIVVFAYLAEGKQEEALSDVEDWHKLQDGPYAWMLFAYVHGRAGHKKEAETFIRKLEAERSKHYVDAGKLTVAYLGAGNNDQALKWIETSLAERSTAIIWLKVDPAYDGLRANPKFQELLSKVGF